MSAKRQSRNLLDTTWIVLRVSLGWVFLWSFFDKVFGLGFATEPASAWINGGSPTYGFLNFGTKGPFAELFASIAGNPIVDWLFMLGLLGIGISLVFGMAVRFGAYSGVVMYLLMYVAGFIPPEHNPFMDEHLINAIVLFGIANSEAARYEFGFGKQWKKSTTAKAIPFLQ